MDMPVSSLKNILLIKYYGLGFGDNIRGTAAWGSLKDKYPDVNLYAIFWANKLGTPAEWVYRSSGIFKDAFFFRKDEVRNIFGRWVSLKSLGEIFTETLNICRTLGIDIVIDQEPHGMEGAILSLWLRAHGIKTVGVAQYPGKRFFYNYYGLSEKKYAKKYQVIYPLEYTEKDYLSLGPLGVARDGRRICVQKPVLAKEKLIELIGSDIIHGRRIVGVNIGCGGQRSDHRRPSNEFFEALIHELVSCGYVVLMTGVASESWLNEACISDRNKSSGLIFNIAGKTTIEDLARVVSCCNVFVSTDSGPYHLSVALDTSTVGLFMWNNRTCFHDNEKTRNVVLDGGIESVDHVVSLVNGFL